jgi:hypothetical protein
VARAVGFIGVYIEKCAFCHRQERVESGGRTPFGRDTHRVVAIRAASPSLKVRPGRLSMIRSGWFEDLYRELEAVVVLINL